MKTLMVALAAFAFLSACHEIPQDAVKPFAGAQEQKTDAGRLTERTNFQNEYLRTGGGKQ